METVRTISDRIGQECGPWSNCSLAVLLSHISLEDLTRMDAEKLGKSKESEALEIISWVDSLHLTEFASAEHILSELRRTPFARGNNAFS
jgi:hypothetical protein